MNRESVIKYSLSLPGTYEDYPFKEDFESAVMKHKGTNKWFGLIMNVKDKVYLNVKTEPEYSELLRKAYDWIIPAYHMNKQLWNTIILCEDNDDSLVKELIKRQL